MESVISTTPEREIPREGSMSMKMYFLTVSASRILTLELGCVPLFKIVRRNWQ